MRLISLQIAIGIAVAALVCMEANAQLAYEITKQDSYQKAYIFKKLRIGSGKWKFKIKYVTTCSPSAQRAPKGVLIIDCQKVANTTISEWLIADCYNSTIDGKIVPAVTRYGYEEGQPEIFKAACNL